MNAQNLQILQQRRFFGISVARDERGPYLPDVDKLRAEGRPVVPGMVVRNVRDAALFNVADADAILRDHPKWHVFQAVQVGDDPTRECDCDAAAND